MAKNYDLELCCWHGFMAKKCKKVRGSIPHSTLKNLSKKASGGYGKRCKLFALPKRGGRKLIAEFERTPSGAFAVTYDRPVSEVL